MIGGNMNEDEKTQFRAYREMAGMTQLDFSKAMGVTIESVKKWENPKYTQVPPKDAWDILQKAIDRQEEIVKDAIKKFESLKDEFGEKPGVMLPYWRTQEDYKKAHPNEEGSYTMAKANIRLVAFELKRRGHYVSFGWEGLKKTLDKAQKADCTF